MKSFICYLLFPAFTSATIHITINENDVEVTGVERSLISQEEIELFGIQDEVLKECVKEYLGGKPDDIYMKSPTPWNDLYKVYKWPQVRTTIKPIFTKTNFYNNTKLIFKREFIQNNELSSFLFKINTSVDLSNNVTKFWRENYNLTYFDVYDNMVVSAFNSNGENVWNYTILNEKYNEMDVKVIVIDLNIRLNPGQEVVFDVIGVKNEIMLGFDFDISLSGNIILNYDRSFRGHHFFSPSLETIMQDCKKPNFIKIEQNLLKLEYFENVEIEVRDKNSRSVLLKRKINLYSDLKPKKVDNVFNNEIPT